jgi:hypothetical protein
MGAAKTLAQTKHLGESGKFFRREHCLKWKIKFAFAAE